MSEAPERIWVGNWLADVGETATWDIGEWRNEPWPTVDVVEYVRADAAEALLSDAVKAGMKIATEVPIEQIPETLARIVAQLKEGRG